jgi:hypothetical protein
MGMSLKHKVGVFFVVTCLLAGVSSLAAQERGSVRGVVKDSQGNTLEGAKVSIAGSTIPQGRDYVTKKDGVFLFQAVPPGAYTVLVTHPSMADFAIEVLVNVDRQTAVNVEMSEVGRVSEEVTVQAVSRTLPTWINMDLQLAYVIPFGGRFSGTVEARLMNIFDTQTILSVDMRQDQPLFEQETSYAPPRKFALSFYLNF